jgi:hypothetical protein
MSDLPGRAVFAIAAASRSDGVPRLHPHPSDRWIETRGSKKCGPDVRDDGVRLMSRWEVLKIILLALAVSVALTAAGALIAIGIAHL